MADQDFNINIRTLADTTGIELTKAQLSALQQAAADGNQRAITALKQLSDAQAEAQGKLGVGLTGSAIGIGTIVTLVTAAISKWKAFNDEQDRMVEGMIRAEEKARALGESIIDMQDAAINLSRIDTEPLEQSFQRLTHDIAVLRTEQSLLNLPEQGEEWKKINREITVNESLLHRVTAAMARQTAEAERAAAQREKAAEKERQAQESFLAGATGSASAQTKSILANEEAFRRTGDPAFQRTADALRRSATPDQAAESDQLGRALNPPPPRPGRAAGVGESQDIVDQIERNRINSEKAQGGDTDVVRAINELRDLWK